MSRSSIVKGEMAKIKAMIKVVLSTMLLCVLISCASTTHNSTAGVTRSQLLLVSPSQIVALSSSEYKKILADAQRKGTLNTNPTELSRVRNIAKRLIAQVGIFRADASRWQWEVNVDNKTEINAYCMPGGKIMVYSGLINKLAATDDELAAVMGHEIAHALREHGREQMSSQIIRQVGLLGLAAYLSRSGNRNSNNILQLAGFGATIFYALPNSREYEREADRIGLELAARAAFNPQGAVSLWNKMRDQTGAKPPEILSTHPSDQNRLDNLSRLAPSMEALYEEAKQDSK